MRTTCQTGIGLVLVLSVVTEAVAQKEPRKDYTGLSYLLFYDKGIAKELKLDEEQLDRAKAVAEKVRLEHQSKLDAALKFKDGPQYGVAHRLASVDTDKALAKVLTEPQMKRLRQIDRQNYQVSTLMDPKNAKALNLSDEQKKQIKLIARVAGPGQSIEERKERYEKTEGVLTAEQKKVWDSLVGPRYDRSR